MVESYNSNSLITVCNPTLTTINSPKQNYTQSLPVASGPCPETSTQVPYDLLYFGAGLTLLGVLSAVGAARIWVRQIKGVSNQIKSF